MNQRRGAARGAGGGTRAAVGSDGSAAKGPRIDEGYEEDKAGFGAASRQITPARLSAADGEGILPALV